MILSYLAAAILAGIGTSNYVGEVSPYAVFLADGKYRSLKAEILFDTADKIETQDGWLVSSSLDAKVGMLSLGTSYSHRETSSWSKDVFFARIGIIQDPLWLIFSIAPSSPNMEAKLEARIRGRIKRVLLETRFWVMSHSTSSSLGSYGYGSTVLIGFGSSNSNNH